MSIWCVRPDEVKVDLVYQRGETTYPFWIKLKKRLTIGEERKVQMSGWRGVKQAADGAGTEIQINWQSQSFSRTATYLTDWSLTGDNDKKLPLNMETLETLEPEVYTLIEGAINDHVTAATEEKKVKPGEDAPGLTLAS